MRKRIIYTIISMAMAATMTACGNDVIVDVVTNDNVSTQETNNLNNNDKNTSSTNTSSEDTDKNDNATNDVAKTNKAGMPTIALEDVKVGVLYIGNSKDTSGYTYAHELGIQGMISNLGLKEEQVIRQDNIDDTNADQITKALDDCIDKGCNIIFTTSWGYMEKTEEYAKKYPQVYFAHGTGYLSNSKNFTNYFGRIYQARYLSGIVAGMKTKSNKIGYVSAMGMDNSECTGGIDAFALGVESVNKNAKVYVAVTNSWFSPDDEEAASKALVGMGCDVLAQHVDTTAPQTVSRDNKTWAIGYNSDMSKETPEATLVSVVWNWSAYYTSYVNSIINATYDGSNYYGGMSESLVSLTELSDLCDENVNDILDEAKQSIISGKFGVFDGVLETNNGKKIGEANKTLDDATITGGINWYYKNVEQINWK